jgi:hypothetical protein
VPHPQITLSVAADAVVPHGRVDRDGADAAVPSSARWP